MRTAQGTMDHTAIALSFLCIAHCLFVPIAAALGLAVLILTAAFRHDLLGELGEKLATLLGASLIAFGHHRNYRLCKAAQCQH